MVSIIVPVYNAAKSLSRCIDSLINQTYEDIEIILVDDGSSDSSEFICKEYSKRDSRIRYYLKQNGGAASARNYGLERAQGEFVQFVDSDDYIDLSFVEKMLNCQKKYNSDLVICGFNVLSYRGVEKIVYKQGYSITLQNFDEYIVQYYNTSIIHSLWTKLYRKKMITTFMNVSYRWGEDYIFNLNYLRNVSNISVIPEALYNYDCLQDSLTRGSYKKQAAYIIKRYNEASQILSNLFHSKEIDSIVAELYLKDLLLDYFNASPLFKISESDISTILASNSTAISKIHSTSYFAEKLKENNCRKIKNMFLKMKIKNVFKSYIQRIIVR